MKDGEKFLPKPIKALGSTSLHLTSSASEGARRLKLEGLSNNRFPKTKRLQMIQYHGWTIVDRQNPNLRAKSPVRKECTMSILRRECVSIQEVIERTEISYTKPEPNAKNGIRTEIAEQKQQEVYETERITHQCQPVSDQNTTPATV